MTTPTSAPTTTTAPTVDELIRRFYEAKAVDDHEAMRAAQRLLAALPKGAFRPASKLRQVAADLTDEADGIVPLASPLARSMNRILRRVAHAE